MHHGFIVRPVIIRMVAGFGAGFRKRIGTFIFVPASCAVAVFHESPFGHCDGVARPFDSQATFENPYITNFDGAT